MAKRTLLDMTQSILSDMGSDQINSLGDTFESDRVASIIKDTYLQLVIDRKWPTHEQLTTLTAAADSNHPTHMLIPEDFRRITFIKYDTADSTETRQRFHPVNYKSPEDFLTMIYMRDDTASNMTVVTDTLSSNSRKLFIQTDKKPEWWTSFDDNYVILDSYDSGVDSTIQQSKMIVGAHREPAWTTSDSFIPDMPSHAFPLLMSEAKSTCFIDIRQEANAKSEQLSRRHRTHLSWTKHRQNGGLQVLKHGRK